ncbi:MAG: hypothetical protein PHP92_04140 [Candidatus Nanoarchaeia archaeon]|nr:hypothetical protein [Candidatus Nanoarchaeia archaeon]
MRIDLKDKKAGEIFQVVGDTRWFKCFEHSKLKFYGYSFLQLSSIWILDYDEAKRLAREFGLIIAYSKITNIILEEIFIPTETRKQYNYWSKTSHRYLARAKVVDGNKNEYYRIGSAGPDNVHRHFLSYRAEIACKRAIVRCIIDILGLQDMVVEFDEEMMVQPNVENKKDDKDKVIEEKLNDEKNKNKITETQLEMIKKLLKSKKKNFVKKKYSKMTEEEAGNIINKLKE